MNLAGSAPTLDGSRSFARGPEHDELKGELKGLLKLLPSLGITRLADITGLDRVGIPVMQAVRPTSLANSVSQGKGLDPASAAISAIMEAAEQCFAERVTHFRTVYASADALKVPAGAFEHYLLPDAPTNWVQHETAWVEASDRLTGGRAWVPLELVHTAFIHPPIPTDGIFFGSSTGLACAFSLEAATQHALLECVERDAIARAQLTHGFFHRFRIDIDTLDDDVALDLIATLRGAGLCTALWTAPAAAKIPVIWCQVMEDGSQPLITPYPADGFAARLDPGDAARAAILEAVQSRLAAISGAREDITRASFPSHVDWPAVEAHRRLLTRGPSPVSFAELHGRGSEEAAGDTERVTRRLAADGISTFVIELDTGPSEGIAAVRVIVPALQPLREA